MICLDDLVPQSHLYRKLKKLISFTRIMKKIKLKPADIGALGYGKERLVLCRRILQTMKPHGRFWCGRVTVNADRSLVFRFIDGEQFTIELPFYTPHHWTDFSERTVKRKRKPRKPKMKPSDKNETF